VPGRDIFLSYASEDRDRIGPLVRALEATGWSVFWDRKIPTGKTWPEVLEKEITSCRSVVVVWSERSVKSSWVREEANEGKKRRAPFVC
jgi:sulfatase modifying factor 1